MKKLAGFLAVCLLVLIGSQSLLLAQTPKFNIGDQVRTTDQLRVRTCPGISCSEINPIRQANTAGVVLEGPTPADGFTWWKIHYDDDVVGWSSDHRLERFTRPAPKFNVGDWVRTTNDLNVREKPCTNDTYCRVKETKPTGTTGVILDFPAPRPRVVDGYNWWEVRYSDGTRGWSADHRLEKISITPPTVETMSATDITSTAATINARITNDGGSAIIERRFDWGTNPNALDQWTANVTVSGNSFSYRLTNLQPNTTYYFRGWAKNSVGWGWGSIVSFTTSQQNPVLEVTPASRDFGNVTVGQCSATQNFTVRNTGGGTLTGTASTSAPFNIVSGSSFSLGANQSTQVTVQFCPATAGSVNGSVNFTSNGGNTSRSVSGVGVGGTQSCPIANLPFRWPVDPDNRGNLSQDYAQYNWGSPNRYHTGLDITGTNVVAVAVGKVIAKCPNGVANGCPGFSTNADNHIMQGVVILEHTLPDGRIIYSLYAHLGSVEPTPPPGQCVSAGQLLGTTGVWCERCNPPRQLNHVHFEIKEQAVLHNPSNSTSPCNTSVGPCYWGYTPNPPAQYGYHDPILYLHDVTKFDSPRRVRVTENGVNLRVGPGGSGTTEYRVLNTANAGEHDALGRSGGTSTPNCLEGWYQIRPTDGSRFNDTSRPGSSIPDGWVCARFISDNTSPPSSFQYPLQIPWHVSQDFGMWNNRFKGYHLAEDVPAPGGTPVYASADGIVKFARAGTIDRRGRVRCGVSSYCALVIIEHDTGSEKVTTLYGHLSTRRGLQVQEGSRVSKGSLIGYVADDDEDGGNWGPHLHFGIRRGPYSTTPICGTWPYVGYTRSCKGVTHQQYLAMWYDPSDFIQQRISINAASLNTLISLGQLVAIKQDRPSKGIQFQINNSEIKEMQISVFDLAGRKVFDSSEVQGSAFVWNLQNNARQPLANGVYLYVVRVRGFDGREYVSEVRKLVIMR